MGDVGSQDISSYARAFRERVRRDKLALDARRQDALSLARRLGQVLLDEFGAASVYLFGSTATGRHYRLDSDIDLAVSGIAPEREITTHAQITLLVQPGFEVDILYLEDAPEIFIDRIRKEGVSISKCICQSVYGHVSFPLEN
ncbi:MAG: nucleotidyltransferase domain-containing protein [Peptococcaceae bacterium]|nr:nucleotidyltransferase domain-containing protein [Peptococcaceae bacterium]